MSILGDIGLAVAAPFVAPTALAMGGDILGAVSQNQTNQVNQGIANQANVTNQAEFDANMKMQMDFAQNGISWRVADAAKNGISPLAALGASEPSYSPSVTAFDSPPYSSPLTSVAAGVSGMGQNISRALSATQSPTQKASDALDLSMKQKQDDLLGVQLANAKLALVRSSQPPGIPNAWTTIMNRDGSTSVVPSEGVAQSLHGKLFGPTLWSLNNGLIPTVQSGAPLLDWADDYQGSRMQDVNLNSRNLP